MLKKFFILVLFFCTSCLAKLERGYYFADKNKIENFDVYNFTKQDLIDNIGNASLELNSDTWLYYSYETKNLHFLKPKINKETILIVYFDENDKIINFRLTTNYKTKDLANLSIGEEKIDVKTNNMKNKNSFWDIFDGLIFTPLQ